MKKKTGKKGLWLILASLVGVVALAPNAFTRGVAETTNDALDGASTDSAWLWQEAERQKQAFMATHTVLQKAVEEIGAADEPALVAARADVPSLSDQAVNLLERDLLFEREYTSLVSLVEDYYFVACYAAWNEEAQADLATVLRGCDTEGTAAARDFIAAELAQGYAYSSTPDDTQRADTFAITEWAFSRYPAAIANARAVQRALYAMEEEANERLQNGTAAITEEDAQFALIDVTDYLWSVDFFDEEFDVRLSRVRTEFTAYLDNGNGEIVPPVTS